MFLEQSEQQHTLVVRDTMVIVVHVSISELDDYMNTVQTRQASDVLTHCVIGNHYSNVYVE